MKMRDLYAEIAEGFDALSHARSGKLTLRTISASLPGPWKTGRKAGEDERAGGIVNWTAWERLPNTVEGAAED